MSEDKVSLVFFDAHAIDMVNTCAGTIANYTQAGHRVTLVGLNPGEKGNASLTGEEYERRKLEVWHKTAEILGVTDVRTLKYKDMETPYNEEVTNTCCDIIREVKADIVVTHWKGTFHKDHLVTYQNTMDAVFLAGLPAFEREYPAYPVKQVYFSDNWEDWEDYEPDTYIDITDTLELKLEAVQQFMNIVIEGSFDYKGFYRALARVRGCLSNKFKYAEAYATAERPPVLGKFFPSEWA